MGILTIPILTAYLKVASDYNGKRHDFSKGIWGGTNRWGYVWGMNGEIYTQALAEKWHEQAKAGKKSVPKGRDKNHYYIGDCSPWIGGYAADCSGLLVGACRSVKASFGDVSSKGWINSCKKQGNMKDMPDVAGLVLWREGHVGLYIGDGMQIEARGTDYGVVVSPVDTQKWTKWGYSEHFIYEEPEPVPTVWTVSRILKLVSPMMKGDDIKELQRRLKAEGHDAGNPDGIFGDKTKKAVEAYQKAVKLTVDGKAGKNTITKLGGVWNG